MTYCVLLFLGAWTGFVAQKTRGNFEALCYVTMNNAPQTNAIDPMRIVPEWRDTFPKTNLRGGYIGDTYPLCQGLPPKAFLSKGATYRFIGGAKVSFTSICVYAQACLCPRTYFDSFL